LTTYGEDQLTLEAPADGPGGFVNFGLGGAGGTTVPMEWWRDYELLFDLVVVKDGLWILDRYDPIWGIFQRTALTTVAPEEAGILHSPVADGKEYEVKHAVVGSDVIHVQRAKQESVKGTSDGGGGGEIRGTVANKVRKGGVVLQLTPGARVILKNLRLKVYRSDAAEAVNAQAATPGR
jgi:hypothetical protein